MRFSLKTIILALVYVFLIENAIAATVGYDAEYRAEFTDNAFKSPNDEEKVEELTHNYRLSLFGNLSGARSKTDFIANLEFRDYAEDTAEDEALSSFLGATEIAITSRTLSWIVADTLGYIDTDPSLKFNTRDQERVNYFVTGPNLAYQIGPDKDIGAKLLYTNHNREGRESDYDKINLDAYWDQYLNIRDNWGVNFEHSYFNYPEEARREDYTVTELSTYFTRNTQSNIYKISVGTTYLKLDTGEDDISGNFNASWDHLFTRRTGLILSAGYDLTNDSVLNDTQLTQTGSFESDDAEGVFYEAEAGAHFYYKGIASEIDLRTAVRSLEYVDGPQQSSFLQNDHQTYSASAEYTRFVGRTLDLSLELSAEKIDYVDEDFDDILYSAIATANYRMGRNIDLLASIEYLQGEGNLPTADGSAGSNDYEEAIFTLGIHWDPYKSRRQLNNSLEYFDLSIIN